MTIRLNNHIKQKIAKALCERKFGKQEKEIVARRAKLALDVYNDTYTAQQRSRMNRLPDGWLATTMYIHPSFAGQSSQMRLPKSVRVPSNNPDKRYDAVHPFTQEFNSIYRDNQKLSEERQAAYTAAMGAMHKCQTLEKLLKVWPEVKPFVPETLTAQVTVALAIPIPQLNTMLGLP